MNDHEIIAWNCLIRLGADEIELGGKTALDLSPIRATTKNKLFSLLHALAKLPGRSGTVHRHVNRLGIPIYLVYGGPNG